MQLQIAFLKNDDSATCKAKKLKSGTTRQVPEPLFVKINHASKFSAGFLSLNHMAVGLTKSYRFCDFLRLFTCQLRKMMRCCSSFCGVSVDRKLLGSTAEGRSCTGGTKQERSFSFLFFQFSIFKWRVQKWTYVSIPWMGRKDDWKETVPHLNSYLSKVGAESFGQDSYWWLWKQFRPRFFFGFRWFQPALQRTLACRSMGSMLRWWSFLLGGRGAIFTKVLEQIWGRATLAVMF